MLNLNMSSPYQASPSTTYFVGRGVRTALELQGSLANVPSPADMEPGPARDSTQMEVSTSAQYVGTSPPPPLTYRAATPHLQELQQAI